MNKPWLLKYTETEKSLITGQVLTVSETKRFETYTDACIYIDVKKANTINIINAITIIYQPEKD